mgnify:CR=1 FL=1
MGRTSKNIKLKIPEKPRKIKGFRSGSCRIATTISSQPRYDHFDTAAYAKFVPAQKNTIQYYIGYIIFVRLSILRRGIKWDIIDS